MKPLPSLVPLCRHCRYYVPEGRRGGTCQKLNVDVKSCWKACALSIPAFETDWQMDGIDGQVMWPVTRTVALGSVQNSPVVAELSAMTSRLRLAIPDEVEMAVNG